MKMKTTIRLVLIVTLLTSGAYWLGYQHGSTSTRGRLNAVSHLKKIGLDFRENRNDIGRFTATGTVTTPKAQTQEP
jgi:hypothetical protein